MKKTLIISFLFIISISSDILSQNYFVVEKKDSLWNYAYYSLIETQNNKYIIGGFKSFRDTSGYWQDLEENILVIDKDGNIINEYNRIISDSLFSIISLFETKDNGVISCSEIKPLDPFVMGTVKFVITQYDSLFNIVYEKKVNLPLDSVNTEFDFAKKHNNTYYISGTVKYDSTSSDYFLLKISPDTVLFKTYDSLHFCVLNILDNGSVYFTGYKDNYCNAEIIKIDTTSLDIDTIICADNSGAIMVFAKTYIQQFGPNKLIYYGYKFTDNILNIYDTNFNLVITDTLENDIDESPANKQTFDFEYKNIIYVGNFVGLYEKYSIIRVDSSLNQIFQKFIELPDSYDLTNITATQDSGCILLALKYFQGKISTRIIKIDKDGNYQPASVKDDIKVSDYFVYPKLVTDIVNIKKGVQMKNSEIVFYNTLGQKILCYKLPDVLTTIDLSFLKSGIYIYNILENNVLKDSGKIIKQ